MLSRDTGDTRDTHDACDTRDTRDIHDIHDIHDNHDAYDARGTCDARGTHRTQTQSVYWVKALPNTLQVMPRKNLAQTVTPHRFGSSSLQSLAMESTNVGRT
jgi:hypothetical protein